MQRYVVKRLLLMIPVVLGVAILIFSILYFVPGDPASIILGVEATPEQLAAKRAELGLDQPFFVQLGAYLKSVFIDFDFGTSYFTGASVAQEIMSRLPRTATIAFVSMLLSLLIGAPLGITAATHQNSWIDNSSIVLSLVGVSIPQFWAALMLVLLFALELGWLPPMGIGSPAHYVLPCIACSLGGIATIARQTRSSMLEVIRSDYIVTARAKGQAERKVVYMHALRNALIPIITVAGNSFGMQLGGALVVETVFTIPGIGMYMMSGINNRDYPIVRGCVLFLAITFSLVMLFVDLVYAYADPRIRAQYSGSNKRRKRKSE